MDHGKFLLNDGHGALHRILAVLWHDPTPILGTWTAFRDGGRSHGDLVSALQRSYCALPLGLGVRAIHLFYLHFEDQRRIRFDIYAHDDGHVGPVRGILAP